MKGVVLLAVLAASASAEACTAIIAGRRASATGRVLVGHNEDNSGTFVRHALIPRRGGRPAVFWSEVKNPAGGDRVSHFFMNEHGVAVLSNNGGVMERWGDETFWLPDEGEASSLTDGGIGYDLRIRMIEEAKTAAEGVRIMAGLVERFGYSQMSRNFAIADSREAWIFEALKGRRYVARRVPDDEVVAYPNCLVFNRLREGDVASPGIRAKGPDFDVIANYQGPRTWKSPYNVHRWQELYRIAAGVDVAVGDEYPFSVRPAHPVSVEDMKKGLSTHYEGRPCEQPERHPTNGVGRVATICRLVTLESLICEFGESAADTALHMTLGRPCETPYRTFRPFAGELPPDVATGDEALRRLELRCAPLKPVKAAVYAGVGPRGRGCIEWMRLLEASPDFDLTLVDGAMVRAGALDGVEVFVMPGGSAMKEKADLGPEGVERLKAFIRGGGGYVGTCAGCFLALDDKALPKSAVGIMPYASAGTKGGFTISIGLNDAGAFAMGMKPGEYKVRYHGGPTLIPSTNAIDGASFSIWAKYTSDFDCPKSSKRMYGKGAIVGGTYGRGRVFATTCHPEANRYTLDLVAGAFRYVLGRPVSFPERVRGKKALAVGVFASTVGGVETARAILDVDKMPGADLSPLTSDEICAGDLAHVDYLVLPDGPAEYYGKKFTGVVRDLVFAYAKAGGRVLAWGCGASAAPPGAQTFASAAELVDFVRREAGDEVSRP